MNLTACNSAPSTIVKTTKATPTEVSVVTNSLEPTKPAKPSQEETSTNPEGTKAWGFYIQEVVRNYETLVVEAINNNDFSLIDNLLVPGSNLYNSQKKLVADLYNKKIQEKLVEFDLKDIQKTDKEGIFKVFVSEKIGVKYPEKQEFETKEFNWIYTVISDKDRPGLSDIEKWNK